MAKSHLLTPEQLKQFKEEGYLIVPSFFSKDELNPVIKMIEGMVDELANELFDAGLIKDKFEREGFYTRLTCLEKSYPGAAVVLHARGILQKPLADLWANPRLLDVVEQIIGPEIAGHPVWNIRTKTPNNPSVTVPWHQDTAYLSPGTEKTMQPTAWIPLIDATGLNGCMQVLAGGENRNEVIPHTCCYGNTWYLGIDEAVLKAARPSAKLVTCEVPMGGFLLLDQLTPHQSLENRSNNIRWSVDLRWQRPNEPHGAFVKDPILMRSADPNFKLVWPEEWMQSDRIKGFLEKHKGSPTVAAGQKEFMERFKPLIAGPWMARWPITNHNVHTRHFQPDNKESWEKN